MRIEAHQMFVWILYLPIHQVYKCTAQIFKIPERGEDFEA